MNFETILLLGATAAALLWAAVSTYVIVVNHRRNRARGVVSRVLDTLRTDDLRSAGIDARMARVRPLLDHVSRDMVLVYGGRRRHTIRCVRGADGLPARPVLRGFLLSEAAAHQRPRDVWRRTAALRVLFQLDHPRALDLLEAAVEDPDGDVAGMAMSLLGTSTEPAAVEILIRALKTHRHPASRIAIHLENSTQRPVEEYRKLLRDEDPIVRFWGATLLGQYVGVEGLEADLVVLAADPDPRVRKAAIASLGRIGDVLAADAATRLLTDPAPFVRAHAARALGDLDRLRARRRSRRCWGMRTGGCAAAKHALEAMGADVWPVLVRCLNDGDGFVRNGAAEVFQNLGILNSLIVMGGGLETLRAPRKGPACAYCRGRRNAADRFAGRTRGTDDRTAHPPHAGDDRTRTSRERRDVCPARDMGVGSDPRVARFPGGRLRGAGLRRAEKRGGRREEAHDPHDALASSRFTIPVSVIVTLHRPVSQLSSVITPPLALSYPELEVIVVADDSVRPAAGDAAD